MKTVVTIVLLFLCFSGYAQLKNCDLKKDSDGILVYTCKSEEERFKSLIAEFTINNTTLDELVAFMRNVSNYPTWQYNMTSAEILKRETDEIMITRSEINAPWPLENREFIVQYSLVVNESADQLHVTTKTIPFSYPKTKGLVRVPFSYAEWIVKKDGNSLKVTYRMRIDPGGLVPVWLVNMAMAEGPYQSFVNLKKQLE